MRRDRVLAANVQNNKETTGVFWLSGRRERPARRPEHRTATRDLWRNVPILDLDVNQRDTIARSIRNDNADMHGGAG
jgi:hypothetical protein